MLRGGRQNTRIIFWRGGTLSYRFSPPGESSRNLSVSVYQLALLWETMFSFSEIFWLFQCICPSYDEWLRAHLPPPLWVFSSFWRKTASPPGPRHPYSPNLTPINTFLFPWMKKLCKGKCFGRGETKNGRSMKRHQNGRVQKLVRAIE